jgi:hypothetical protein
MALTALRRGVVLSLKLQGLSSEEFPRMSNHQAACRQGGVRAPWLAIELAFYLLALVTLGAQLACLLTFCPT